MLFLDSVVAAVCSAHLSQAASTSAAPTSTLASTEQLLQLLLGARLADPVLLNWHARSLECFSKLLARKPELVPAVMQKVLCCPLCPVTTTRHWKVHVPAIAST